MKHTMVDTVKNLYPSSSIWTKKCRTTTTALIAYMMSLLVWAKTADTYYYTSAFSPTRYASHSLSAATRVGNASSRYSISHEEFSLRTRSSSNSSVVLLWFPIWPCALLAIMLAINYYTISMAGIKDPFF